MSSQYSSMQYIPSTQASPNTPSQTQKKNQIDLKPPIPSSYNVFPGQIPGYQQVPQYGPHLHIPYGYQSDQALQRPKASSPSSAVRSSTLGISSFLETGNSSSSASVNGASSSSFNNSSSSQSYSHGNDPSGQNYYNYNYSIPQGTNINSGEPSTGPLGNNKPPVYYNNHYSPVPIAHEYYSNRTQQSSQSAQQQMHVQSQNEKNLTRAFDAGYPTPYTGQGSNMAHQVYQGQYMPMQEYDQNSGIMNFSSNPYSFIKSDSEANNLRMREGKSTGSPSGPIPATEPIIEKNETTGEEWMTFEYSKNKVRTTFRLYCGNFEDLNSQESKLDQEFKNKNCVYPKAMCAESEYTGKRYRYEKECNMMGWQLAHLNADIRGHRGLIQRGVDSWRNTRSDEKLRSRRVRRITKLNESNMQRQAIRQQKLSQFQANQASQGSQNVATAPTAIQSIQQNQQFQTQIPTGQYYSLYQVPPQATQNQNQNQNQSQSQSQSQNQSQQQNYHRYHMSQ